MVFRQFRNGNFNCTTLTFIAITNLPVCGSIETLFKYVFGTVEFIYFLSFPLKIFIGTLFNLTIIYNYFQFLKIGLFPYYFA